VVFGDREQCCWDGCEQQRPIGGQSLARAGIAQAAAVLGLRFSGAGVGFLGTDPVGDSLYISSVGPLSVGGAAVSFTGGWVAYSPAASLTNDDTFNYTVADGRGGFSLGTASVVVLTNRGPTLEAVWESGGGGALRIVGSGIPYRSYTFQYKEGMGAAWQPMGDVMSDAFGVFTHVESLSLGVSNRFCRVTTY